MSGLTGEQILGRARSLINQREKLNGQLEENRENGTRLHKGVEGNLATNADQQKRFLREYGLTPEQAIELTPDRLKLRANAHAVAMSQGHRRERSAMSAITGRPPSRRKGRVPGPFRG